MFSCLAFTIVACTAQDPTMDEPTSPVAGKGCDNAAVGVKCATDKLLCPAANVICFCGAFVSRDEYVALQKIGAKCFESPDALSSSVTPAPSADAGSECAVEKSCSLLTVKCIDASSRMLVCTLCGWLPESVTCPLADVGTGSCALNGLACTDMPEKSVAACTPPWVCCKQSSGVKLWVAGTSCPSADSGISTDADAATDAAMDSGSSPADSAVADADSSAADTTPLTDSAPPADSAADSAADTAPLTDSAPPVDSGVAADSDASTLADSSTADTSAPPTDSASPTDSGAADADSSLPADASVSDTAPVFDTYRWEFPKGYVQVGEVRFRWYTGITAPPCVLTKVLDVGPVEGGVVYECKVLASPSTSPTLQGEHMDVKCPAQLDGTRYCYAFDQSCAWYGGGCAYYGVVGKNFGTVTVTRGSVTSQCVVRSGAPKPGECRLVPNGSVSTSFNAVVEPS